MRSPIEFELRRRTLLAGTAAVAAARAGLAGAQEAGTAPADAAPAGPETTTITLNVNGTTHELTLDNRVTLLDALREHLNRVRCINCPTTASSLGG